LPEIASVGMHLHLHSDNLSVDEAYSSDGGQIDLTKDFYPFGEKPKFNDTLWLAQDKAFSNAGATVTLRVEATTPPGSKIQTPPPAAPFRRSETAMGSVEWVLGPAGDLPAGQAQLKPW